MEIEHLSNGHWKVKFKNYTAYGATLMEAVRNVRSLFMVNTAGEYHAEKDNHSTSVRG